MIDGRLLHHEILGSGDPVMLIAGLSGVGRGWGAQVELFGSRFTTIVPDHPGTGSSPPPAGEYTIAEHAAAMADLIRRLGCGPTHLVGSSTGGAIAQVMALDHADVVRSTVLASSWARPDDHFRHQFRVRKEVLQGLGGAAYARTTALFLHSPRYFRDHFEEVEAWCARAASTDPETMAARIDMILAHDELDRIGAITVPTLVLVGSEDVCTPQHLSEEIAATIPRAELMLMAGGHLIYKEDPAGFHGLVSTFLRRN